MAGVEIKKREGESVSSLIYRFTKKVQHSGVLREVKRRRFRARAVSRVKRKSSALHRVTKRAEIERSKKLGITIER
jgi:ribosomal protein S21